MLHHTGRTWDAITNVSEPVAPGGRLFISLYNDHGLRSRLWTIEKRSHVGYPIVRPIFVVGFILASLRYYDLLDWLGGDRGLVLDRLVRRRAGCNEYVFTAPTATAGTNY